MAMAKMEVTKAATAMGLTLTKFYKVCTIVCCGLSMLLFFTYSRVHCQEWAKGCHPHALSHQVGMHAKPFRRGNCQPK